MFHNAKSSLLMNPITRGVYCYHHSFRSIYYTLKQIITIGREESDIKDCPRSLRTPLWINRNSLDSIKVTKEPPGIPGPRGPNGIRSHIWEHFSKIYSKLHELNNEKLGKPCMSRMIQKIMNQRLN